MKHRVATRHKCHLCHRQAEKGEPNMEHYYITNVMTGNPCRFHICHTCADLLCRTWSIVKRSIEK